MLDYEMLCNNDLFMWSKYRLHVFLIVWFIILRVCGIEVFRCRDIRITCSISTAYVVLIIIIGLLRPVYRLTLGR